MSFYSVNISFISPDQPTVNQTLAYSEITTSLTPQAIFNVYNKDRLKVYIDGGLSLNLTSYSPKNGSSTVSGSFLVQSGIVFNKKLEISIAFSPKTPQGAGSLIYDQHLYFGIKYLFGNN